MVTVIRDVSFGMGGMALVSHMRPHSVKALTHSRQRSCAGNSASPLTTGCSVAVMVTSNTQTLDLVRARRLVAERKVAQRRRVARLTQAEIAAAIGVSRSTVASWEAGRRTPRREVALRYVILLDALGHPLEIPGRG